MWLFVGLHSEFSSQALEQHHRGTEYGLSLRRNRGSRSQSQARAVTLDVFHHGRYMIRRDADVVSVAASSIVYSCRLYEREDDRNHAQYWEVKPNDMSRALQRSEQHSAWLRARDQSTSTPAAGTRFTVGQGVMAVYFANGKFYSAVVAVVPDDAAEGEDRMYTVHWADGDANHREVSEGNIRAA